MSHSYSLILRQMVKGQRHRVTKCKHRVEDDRREFALYRVADI